MKSYPGYDGPLQVSGKVNVRFRNDGDYFQFSLNANGLSDSCNECEVHIHTGTTCDDAALVGGHFWNPNVLKKDTWSAAYGAFYNSVGGKASSEFMFKSGFDMEENTGKAVVVHDQDGTRISCGILKVANKRDEDKDVLFATVGTYPGYDGLLEPKGRVEVDFDNKSKFVVSLYGVGLAEECTNCGVHIHTGTSCDNEALVGGHYWKPNTFTTDPWNAENGPFYDTKHGKTFTVFELDSGYTYFENVGHVVVLHDQDGSRIGCGKLTSGFLYKQ